MRIRHQSYDDHFIPLFCAIMPIIILRVGVKDIFEGWCKGLNKIRRKGVISQ
jgi:hypothetical protein